MCYVALLRHFLSFDVHSLRASSLNVVSKASRERSRERVSGGCTCVSFRVQLLLDFSRPPPPPLSPPPPHMDSLLAGSLRASCPFGGYREKSSLPRSLASRFPRPISTVCSHATLQANLNGALNQALGMGQTSQKQFSDKHSVANSKTCLKVSFNFSGLWTLLCASRPPTGMCSACYSIRPIKDISFDLQFLSRSHQKTLVIFREGRQLKT